MNKGLLALNIFLFIAVGILFILFFNKKTDPVIENKTRSSEVNDSLDRSPCSPVAYFDMDSVEANFTEFKKMQTEVVAREAKINDSINQMRSAFQSYYMQLQRQSANLTQGQKDSLGNQLAQMDMDIKNRASDMNQRYQAYYMNKQQEIITKIKNFCREFNKDRKYSYIIAKEPGLFYYTDTSYNVTGELLKGLNAFYSKKKP